MQIKEKKKREMDFKEIEEIAKNPNEGGVIEKKQNLISTLKTSNSNHNNNNPEPEPVIDSGSALQLFLDHIPITSIPSIKNSFSRMSLFLSVYFVFEWISFNILLEFQASNLGHVEPCNCWAWCVDE